jgi:asparagine synthase (glutamine-hydrolysing)
LTGFLARYARSALVTFGGEAVSVPGQACRVLIHGYVANRDDLRRRFSLPAAAGDADFIAHAYRRFGPGLAAHVFGQYAAAIVDDAVPALLLTHDALGVLGLFHAETPEGLLFGSSLADLVAETGVGELDRDYIAQALAGAEDHGARTPYSHIRRLRQGHAMGVRAGGAREVRTYDPASIRPLRLTSPSVYEDQLRELAIEAVRTALPSQGKVWSELSGGLDSSSVVAIAAGVLGAPVETFSTVFSRSPEADETDWIAAVLKAYPLVSHRLDASQTPPFGPLPDTFQAEPTGAALIQGFDNARRALLRAHRVDVVLTGMCGDAVFVGDSPQPYYLADIINPFQAARELTLWTRRSGLGRPPAYWLRRFCLEPRLNRLSGRPFRPPPAPPPWSGPAMTTWRPSAPLRRRIGGMSIGDEYFWDRVLRGALLVGDGQQLLPGACEFRNPWLYPPLVEFMAAAPWPVKLRPDLDRPLQRRALSGVLPEITRSRRGKRTPGQAFFAGLGASGPWIDLLTRRPAIIEQGWVDGDGWRQAVDLAGRGFCRSPSAFMRACMVESWFATLPLAPRTAREYRERAPMAKAAPGR